MRNWRQVGFQGVGVRGRGPLKTVAGVENSLNFSASRCAVACDFDGDGLISVGDIQRLLRELGIRNIKGGYARIVQQVPRVSPVVVVGWSLYAWHTASIKQPVRYVSVVLQDVPGRREAVPAPFDLLAAQPPDVWTLFAEHTWLRRYLGQADRVPIPDELHGVYACWRRIYGEYPLRDLPLGLGETAAQHVKVWQALANARSSV